MEPLSPGRLRAGVTNRDVALPVVLTGAVRVRRGGVAAGCLFREDRRGAGAGENVAIQRVQVVSGQCHNWTNP